MKVGVFVNNKNDSTEFDPYMDKYSSDIELVKLDYRLNPSTVDRLKESGCEAVNYFSAVKEDEDFFRKMAEAGIKYICTTIYIHKYYWKRNTRKPTDRWI